MSAETPGRPTEQEWAEALCAEWCAVDQPATAADVADPRHRVAACYAHQRAATALRPPIERERQAAKADGWDVGYLRGTLDATSDLDPADNPYRAEQDGGAS